MVSSGQTFSWVSPGVMWTKVFFVHGFQWLKINIWKSYLSKLHANAVAESWKIKIYYAVSQNESFIKWDSILVVIDSPSESAP